MTQKRILILDGNPGEASLSRYFADSYGNAAKQAGAKIRLHHLSEMAFDMDFGKGNYTQFKALEAPLEAFMTDLEWAEHIVIMTPLWWGGLPAKLKGLFDRALLPGRAFNTRVSTRLGMPTPMLTGKTARVIVTSDTPAWFERLIYKQAFMHQTTKQILGFVGIKPTRYTWFSPASEATEQQVRRWSKTVSNLGKIAA
ncbi:NAD(P)H-dependent oxidoreductase [Loktanella agnita]|uniref:NAD(P)H-dependent oxidoreductase n=1 Tax=Loktanella agnita TaxID=287097 RepID=UPI00398836DD